MAFLEAIEYLEKLPAEGDPLTDTDAQVFLSRWVASLEYQPTALREWALAEEVVELGVMAELEKEQLRASGRSVPTDVYVRLGNARTLRQEYNDMRTTEADTAQAAIAYTSSVPW